MTEAMTIAVSARCAQAVRALHQACPNPQASVRAFRSESLRDAAARGDVEIVRSFLEAFASAEASGVDGHFTVPRKRFAILAAASAGAVEVVSLIHRHLLENNFANLFAAEAAAAAPPEHKAAI